MKTSALFLALAMVASLATLTRADDTYLSPKARQAQQESNRASSTTPDMIDRTISAASPKSVAFAASVRTVSVTTEDKLTRALPAISPRALANDSSRVQVFQVAPLK